MIVCVDDVCDYLVAEWGVWCVEVGVIGGDPELVLCYIGAEQCEE